LKRERSEEAGSNLAAVAGDQDDADAGAGVSGVVGVSRALKAAQCPARVVALEPAASPTLTTGTGGPHRVEGIG